MGPCRNRAKVAMDANFESGVSGAGCCVCTKVTNEDPITLPGIVAIALVCGDPVGHGGPVGEPLLRTIEHKS
jgi:hypothetical protein